MAVSALNQDRYPNQLFEQFVELQKENSSDWFKIESNEEGTRWFGTCWHVYNHVKYEFDVEFDIPATYPTTSPEIELPQLDGKTAKMYRGGKICLTDHFFPLWSKNVPKFGIVHALALGVRLSTGSFLDCPCISIKVLFAV